MKHKAQQVTRQASETRTARLAIKLHNHAILKTCANKLHFVLILTTSLLGTARSTKSPSAATSANTGIHHRLDFISQDPILQFLHLYFLAVHFSSRQYALHASLIFSRDLQ